MCSDGQAKTWEAETGKLLRTIRVSERDLLGLAVLPDGRMPAGPVTVHLAERFKIEHGLITEIEAIFTNQAGTADGVSGWPDSPS